MNFEKSLIEIGVPQEVALKIAKHFAGDTIYIRKKMTEKSLRDAEMKARFNGKNCRELAKDYDLTVRHVRKICLT